MARSSVCEASANSPFLARIVRKQAESVHLTEWRRDLGSAVSAAFRDPLLFLAYASGPWCVEQEITSESDGNRKQVTVSEAVVLWCGILHGASNALQSELLVPILVMS